MKIYLGESPNFMGYMLIGDLGQEYATNIYSKNKDLTINIPEKSLEMCIFYIYSAKPIYTQNSPDIFIYHINSIGKDITTISEIKELENKISTNKFFEKYKHEKQQNFNIINKENYQDIDLQRLMKLNSHLDIKERDLCILNNKILNHIKDR